MSAYTKSFNETIYIYIYFLIKDDEMLEKHDNILNKINYSIKKDLLVNQYTMKNI